MDTPPVVVEEEENAALGRRMLCLMEGKQARMD